MTKKKKSSHFSKAFVFTLLTQLFIAYFEMFGLSLPHSLNVPIPSAQEVIVEVVVSPLPPFTRMEETQYPLGYEPFSNDINLDFLIESDGPVRGNIPISALPDPSQILPLQLLSSGQHSRISNLVMQNGVGFLEIDESTGYNLLHHLARSYHYILMDIALRWMRNPQNLSSNRFSDEFVNKKSNIVGARGGDTPLHLAVTHPNNILAYLMIDVLILYGADPLIPNNAGHTPMDLAATYTRDPYKLQIIKKERDISKLGLIDAYLDCRYGRKGSKAPEDPVNWLLNGSTDKFKTSPRGIPYFDIVRD